QASTLAAKTPPPPATASFVKHPQAIQDNGGRPPAVSQMRQVQTQSENPQQARPSIKIAPPSQPATPQNVRTNGSGQPQINTGNRPGQPQTNVQPNVENNSNRPPASNNAGKRQSNGKNN